MPGPKSKQTTGGLLDSSPYVSDKPGGTLLDHVQPDIVPTTSNPYSGPLETPYDIGLSQSAESGIDKIRSEKQSDWKAFGNALLQTVSTVAGQTLQGVGAMIDIPSMAYNAAIGKPNNYEDALGFSKAGTDLQDWTKELAPIFTDPERSFGHMAWWLQNAPNVASTLSMLIPQLGVAKIVGGAARAMRIGELATELAQVGLGAFAGRHIENYMEAGGVYKTTYENAIANGIDGNKAAENASSAASMDYAMNYANLAFDVLQLSSIIKPFKAGAKIAESFLGNRVGAIGELGFKAAEARAIDMTGKGVLDGAKWYEKVAGSTLRYGRPLAAQLSEGVEEGWNTISQKEGERKGRILNGTATDEDNKTTWMDRLSKYVTDKDVAESGFWGILGGMAFEHAGTVINKGISVVKGKEGALESSVKAADISARKNLISDYIKVANDASATPIEKLKTKHKNLFKLTESAMANDNLDLLLGDMQDGQYQEIIAKQSGLDVNAAKQEIGKLREDIEYIANAYNNYAGRGKAAWNNFSQTVNTSALGDDTSVNETVNRNKFRLKKMAAQFVEPHVAQHLTMLDYYSHKATETTLQAHNEINQDVAKINFDNNPHFKPVLDNHLRTVAIDKTIKAYENDLSDMMDAGVSDSTVAITKSQIENLKKEKQRLAVSKTGLKSLIDGDFASNSIPMNFDDLSKEIEDATKVTDEMEEQGFRNPIVKSYESIIDDQMTKYRFAKERSLMIENPGKYYGDLTMDTTILADHRKRKEEEAKRYGYEKNDNAVVKELKRRVIDTFDNDLQPTDPRYKKTEREAYEQIFKDAYEEYVKDYHDDLPEQLAGYQEKLSKFDVKDPDNFDFAAYTKTRANIDAINKIINDRKPKVDTSTVSTSSVTANAGERNNTGSNSFEKSYQDIIFNLDELKTPLMETGINGMFYTADLLRAVAEKDSIVVDQLLDFANREFVETVSIRDEEEGTPLRKLLQESFDAFNNNFLEVVTETDKFIADFKARVEKYKEENDVPEETEIKIDTNNPTPSVQISANDIVYDEMPEPVNTTEASDIYSNDQKDAREKGAIQHINVVTEKSANEGFVPVSHGAGMIAMGDTPNGRRPVYKDGVPVLNPSIQNNDYTFDLSLLDPNSPNYLKAGDTVEIHYGNFNSKTNDNSLTIYKKGKDGLIFIGYVDKGTIPQTQEASGKVRELAKTHKVLTATLATNSLSWGEPLTTQPLDGESRDGKKFLMQQALSKVLPLNNVNKPGGVYFAIHNGADFAIKNSTGSLVNVRTVMPNNTFIQTDINPQHSGQLIALIPTNHVPIGTKDANRNDRVTYQARIVRTANTGSARVSTGENIATSLIKKLIDPYNNQDFIKSLSEILPKWTIDVNKSLEMQPEAMKKLYTKNNVNLLMNKILFSKARKSETSEKTGDDYRYPFYVDVAPSNKPVLVNGQIGLPVSLQVRYGNGTNGVTKYYEIGSTDFSNGDIIKEFKNLDDYTGNKPFRVDAKEIGKQYNSGSYTAFGVVNGELQVKEYQSGYFQYLDENKVASATFASIPYSYNVGGQTKTARTFFDVPKIKINLVKIKEYQLSNKNEAPILPANNNKRVIGGFSKIADVPANKAENVKTYLESSTGWTRTADGQFYIQPGTGRQFKRVSNVLFKKADSSELLEQAGNFGNVIDKIVRDFFGKGVVLQSNYSEIPQEHYVKILSKLNELKKQFDKNGEVPYSDNRVVFDEETGIAGELDLLTVDAENNVRIYDTKSLKGTLAEMTDNHVRISKWVKQQNAYRILMHNQFGVNISEMEIIPIELGYGSENKSIVSLNTPSNVILNRVDEIKGEKGTIKLKNNQQGVLLNELKAGAAAATKAIPTITPTVSAKINTEKVTDIESRRKKSISNGVTAVDGTSMYWGNYYEKSGALVTITRYTPQEVIAEFNKKYDEELASLEEKQLPSAGGYNFFQTANGKFKAVLNSGRQVGTFDTWQQAKDAAKQDARNSIELEDDESPNVVGGILTDIYDVSSIHSALQDPTVSTPVRSNLIEMANGYIMDVLYRETLGRGKKLNNDDLKTFTKRAIERQLKEYQDEFDNAFDDVQDMQERGMSQDVIDQFNEEIKNIKGYIAYHNQLLNKFDNESYDPATKAQVGEFIGYFKTAFFFVSGSKLVKTVGTEEEIYDLSNDRENEGLSARYKDNWYTTINPKDTVSFQTKIFLSRVPMTDKGSNYIKTAGGAYKYHDLNNVLRTLWKAVNEIRPDHFLEDLADYNDNPIVADLFNALDMMDDYTDRSGVKWSFTKEQLIKKIATSTLLQSRKTRIVVANVNEETGKTKFNIIDGNRQQIEQQLIDDWGSGFKNKMDQFYDIAVDNKTGVPEHKLKKLKTREHGTYEVPGKNTVKIDIPKVSEVGEMMGGDIKSGYNDSRLFIFSKLQDIADQAKKEPNKTIDVVLPDYNKEDFTIRDDNGNELTTLTLKDIQSLLNYIQWPSNVRLDKKDVTATTELGSVKSSIANELAKVTDNGNSYASSTYKLIGTQLRRLGMAIAENPEDDASTLQKLESRRGQGKLYKIYDPKATTLQSYLQDNLESFVTELMGTDNIEKLDNPFANLNLRLRNLAKLSKGSWPNLYSPNITNLSGDNEFTVNPPHYLSNRINQIKNDPELRQKYLQTPFAGKSTIINQIFKDEKTLNQFDIFDFKGIRFGNNSSSNKEMNDLKQMIADYALFQNQELSGVDGRGLAYFITAHGESKTAPIISFPKRHIDFDFKQDNDGKLSITLRRKNSDFYNDLYSQFRSELDRVLHGHKVLSIINEVKDSKGLDAAIDFARQNYKEGFHFTISKNGFNPGSAYKFFLFGKAMFLDAQNKIYNNGLLLPQIQTLATDPENEEGLRVATEAFDTYIDSFLNGMLDKHIDHLQSYGSTFFKRGLTQVGYKGDAFFGMQFPLFDDRYVNKLTTRLLEGEHPPKLYSGGSYKDISVPYHGDTSDNALTEWPDEMRQEIIEERERNNETLHESNFPEVHQRFIVADFLFNHLLFKNTYFQLTEDPADFAKTETYDGLIEEMNKRLKHHLGPGNLSAETSDNEVHTIWFNDITPAHLKVRVPISTINDGENNIKHAINFMLNHPKLKAYVGVEGNNYILPSNYEDLGALHDSHYDNKSKMVGIMLDNLNQKMTDGGTLLTTREVVARMLKAGDIDSKDAPAIYKLLSDKNLNSHQIADILNRIYGIEGLLVNKYIYSGNRMTDYNEGDTKTILNDFIVKKDSEVAMTPALAKDTQWMPVIEHLEELENKMLSASGIDPLSSEAFSSGLILSPISARKSQGMGAINLFNEAGLYTGEIKTAPMQILDRSQMREQLKSQVKDAQEITASTQALPFSQLDVTSNIDFARVQTGPLKFDGTFNNVQLNNARYRIYNQLMGQDMSYEYANKGIKIKDGIPTIDDMKQLVKSIRQQIVNQNGVGVVLEPFKVENNQTPIPLSFTPFGIVAQSVFLNGLTKSISSRVMPGQTLIQMTAIGFNKDNIQTSPLLKGFRLKAVKSDKLFDTREAVLANYTREELAKNPDYNRGIGVKKDDLWIERELVNGVNKYRPVVNIVQPAEIAISWNFRDKKGKLFLYEEFVNENGTPKLDKIDSEFLKMIGYRTPNTPHNTMAYVQVVKFLPPSHRDIVQVPAQIMTNMSADLDVDKLNLYHYNYELIDGKIVKVQGVLHGNQKDNASLLNTESNIKRIKDTQLRNNYEYVQLKKELRTKQSEYAKVAQRLKDAIEADGKIPVETLLADRETRKKYIELLNNFNEIESKIADPNAELRALFYAVQNDELEAKDAFKDKYDEFYAQLYTEDASDEELEKQATEKLINYLDELVRKQEKDIKKGRGFKADQREVEIANQLSKELTRYENDAVSNLKRLGEGDIETLKTKLDAIENQFNSEFDVNKLSIYQKQTKSQLENAMLDSFMTLYSNPNMFKKMTSPLSTEFLKEKVTDKKLQWYKDGKLQETSIQEGILNKGFASINDYQSQADFKNSSTQNSDLISAFASELHGLVQAQNQGWFVAQPANGVIAQPLYGHVTTNKEEKMVPRTILVDGKLQVEVKRDANLNDDGSISVPVDNTIYNEGGMKYKYRNRAYRRGGMTEERRPNTAGRWRLDSVYHINNSNKRVNVSTVLESGLQAVLDGIKDPIAPKIKLNMNNVNVFVGHTFLGYSDEIVPLLHQPIIQKYERDVRQEGVNKRYATPEVKADFINKYAKTYKLFDPEEQAKVFEKAEDPIQAMEMLLKDQNIILTEADLNDMLVQENGLDGTEHVKLYENKMFHYKQLTALMNYLKAEQIGNQITTAVISTNTFRKGIPGLILDVDDKYNDFLDLHRVSTFVDRGKTKTKITSSVPLIGNIHHVSEILQSHVPEGQRRSTSSFYDLSVIHGLQPVTRMLNNMGNSLFTELSPMFREVYSRYDEIRRQGDERSTSARRTKLATAFTSFIWSNPNLYEDMFETTEEYNFFEQYGRNAMMVFDGVQDQLEELNNKGVFVFDKTLAQAAQELANKRMPNGKTYGSIYKLLNAFKYITGNSKLGQPDYILYMNIADLKGSFENEFAMSIPQMLDAKDPQVRALAKQLVLYAHLNGGISTPNSYIKHIPQSIRDRFNISKKLREVLDMANGATYESTQMKNAIADSFLLQYWQHNPYEAPRMKVEDLIFRNDKDKTPWFIHPELKFKMAYLNNKHKYSYNGKKKGFVFQFSDPGGEIKLAAYTTLEGGEPVLIELDKAGNSRWNSNEYLYNSIIDPVQTQIYKNMSGSSKKELYSSRIEQVSNENENMDLADIYKEMSVGTQPISDTLLNIMANSNNPANASLALALNDINVGVEVEFTSDTMVNANGQIKGGSYNPETDSMKVNPSAFFNESYSMVPAFEETILHETIHSTLDRAITSIILPDARFGGKKFFTKLQQEKVKPSVENLRKVFGVLQAVMENENLEGNEAINEIIEKYDNWMRDGDRYQTAKHAYVQVFKRMQELKEKGYSIIKPDQNNYEEMKAVGGLVKELSAYFMTNKEFQQLLNDITIDDSFKKEYAEAVKGKGNVFQAILDWILDILNQLSGGKMWDTNQINSRNLLQTKIDDNTLAHFAASNILNLIDDTTGANLKNRAAAVEAEKKKVSDALSSGLGESNNIIGNEIPVSLFDFSNEEMDEVDAMGKCK